MINVVTNDLAAEKLSLEVADRLMDFYLNFLDELTSLKQVVVRSAIPRSNHIKGDPKHFKAKVENFSTYLFHLCDVETKVFYHLQKGFWKDPISSWLKDGILPNTLLDRKKYKSSIRSAIFKNNHRTKKGLKLCKSSMSLQILNVGLQK